MELQPPLVAHSARLPSHALAHLWLAVVRCAVMAQRTYRLIGPDGAPYESAARGALGGHRRTKLYGRLDCRAALRALERGGPYASHRVFFADEVTAIRAGFRPCAVCMPSEYREWKARGGR